MALGSDRTSTSGLSSFSRENVWLLLDGEHGSSDLRSMLGVLLASAAAWRGRRAGPAIRTACARPNERNCLLVQAETASALEQLDEIAAVDGVDGVFIGPAELPASMGRLGEPGHPEVRAAIERTNTASEGRVGHVARLGCQHEAAVLPQGSKVLDQLGVHRQCPHAARTTRMKVIVSDTSPTRAALWRVAATMEMRFERFQKR